MSFNLHLHDTATRSTRKFEPLVPGTVSMYVCGATVQGMPHIGHMRAAVVFDVLRRWCELHGLDVTLVRNVTDIDDKILTRAKDEGRPWWAVAAHYEREFTWAYDVLGIKPPTGEPRATGHITQMIELMERLIDSGHAYAVDGDVYFDVRSFPEYGQLSGQRVDDLLPAADSAADSRKKDPRDFALWKGAKPGEPSWPTPWGAGRPGWHLECSAMSTAYLGPEFDIHGGGLDLVFPHHENEVAQSKAAGDGFARFWLHNSWITMAGEKMSKSLGNSTLVRELVREVRPIELRWYLVGAHYRSNLELSEPALKEAATSFRRIEGFLNRAAEAHPEFRAGDVVLPSEFATAMNEDLGTPAALAVVHAFVTAGNSALADKRDCSSEARSVLAMLDVLGVDPTAPEWAGSSDSAADASLVALDALVQAQLERRARARADKDWSTADEVRDLLKAVGIQIEDTSEGARWSLVDTQEES